MSKYLEKQANISELINLIHSFSSIRRYSNKTLIKEENVAEHSSIVGIISLFLYDNLSTSDQSLVDINKTLAFTIFHDLDEIFTGDMINPVKYYKPEIKNGVEEYADLCMKEFQNKSGISSILRYTQMDNLNEYEYSILKLADIISVFVKFRIENGLGNRLLDVDYKNIAQVISNHSHRRLFKNSHDLHKVSDIIIELSLKLDSPNDNYSNILGRDFK